MRNACQSDDSIRIAVNDVYPLLFSLGRKQNPSAEEIRQIWAIERLISDNITRKDIPAYSLQQVIELPVEEAERIFGQKLEEFQVISRIREAVADKCVLRLV